MEGTSCKITPINVGSGDSILVQLRGVHGDEYYLIDGGPKDYFENLKGCLEQHNLIEGAWVEGRSVLQCNINIIVTHPDQDHVNGITKLMEQYYIAGWIIITEAFDQKDSVFLQNFFSNLTSTHSRALGPFSSTGTICCQSLTEKCLCYVPRARGAHVHSMAYVSEPDPVHKLITGTGSYRWNKSSIITTVRNPYTGRYVAMLTGDSFGDLTLNKLHLCGEHIPIFQVPHHGSKNNINFGVEGTLERCTELYSKFSADVYVISGNDKNHPHAEVLSGILKAVYDKNDSGKIVLTGTRGLSAEKNYQIQTYAHW